MEDKDTSKEKYDELKSLSAEEKKDIAKHMANDVKDLAKEKLSDLKNIDTDKAKILAAEKIALAQEKMKNIKIGNFKNIWSNISGAVIGMLVGIPLSYYFQPDMVRMKVSLVKYVVNIKEMLGYSDVAPTILVTVTITGIIGFIIQRKRNKLSLMLKTILEKDNNKKSD